MSQHIHVSGTKPDKRMAKFIREHHVFTLATRSEKSAPWCASCFYVYLEDLNWFVFTTDDDTRHGSEMIMNPGVAVCIALETTITGKIRGVQITGTASKADGEAGQIARKAFIRRFPVAMLKKTNLWIIEPDYIKMTDNRLGFGIKLIWQKGEE